jgi:two-component sensor histidine kinase
LNVRAPDIQFEEYGVTESFLVILLNEIIVNAFKYYASDNKKSVVLQWVDNGDHQTIECHNPSTRSERTRIKGDGKGHTFLSTLARKTNIHFIKPVYQDDFVIRFNIPTQFLTNTF